VSGPSVLANACWITYFPASNSIGLVNDSASAYEGYVTVGQTTTITNSNCTLSGSGSSVQTSGTLLTLTASLAFKSNFATVGSGATKTVYAYPINAAGKAPSALVAMGSWTLP
jgi:hypothetical protein